MKTSLIIASRNRAENLDCMLTAIDVQFTDREYDVTVVDDRSTDETPDIVRKHEGIRYVKVPGGHETWNASIPRNLGVRETDGEILFFLDSDVLLPPGSLDRIITAFVRGNRSRVLIGSYHWLPPMIVTPDDVRSRFQHIIDGRLPPKAIKRRGMAGMDDIRKLSFDKAENPQQEFYSFTDALACFGGFLLMTRATFLAAGGYDETMLAGVEDGDFGITLYEMGVKVSYLKDPAGYHIAHEQPPGRDAFTIAQQVKRLDEKHHVDMIHQSGKAYRKWGISWEPPSEFYDNDPAKLEEYKKLWAQDPQEFMLKINKKYEQEV